MSVDKIGNASNLTAAVYDRQTASKMHAKSEAPATNDDMVLIGKSDAIKATQVKWPPLLPIGHTQEIYKLDNDE